MARPKVQGRRRSAAEMRELLEQWARSGVSLAVFAAQHGVQAKTLGWWRWELRRRDRAAAAVEFVEVTPPPRMPVFDEGFEVRLPTGVAVGVPVHFDADALGRLLGVLARC